MTTNQKIVTVIFVAYLVYAMTDTMDQLTSNPHYRKTWEVSPVTFIGYFFYGTLLQFTSPNGFSVLGATVAVLWYEQKWKQKNKS